MDELELWHQLEAEVIEETVLTPIPSVTEDRIREIVREEIAKAANNELAYAKQVNSLLHPATVLQREFTEFETVLHRLFSKFGTDWFDILIKQSTAVKCSKVGKHTLQAYMKEAESRGLAEPKDSGKRNEWRLIRQANKREH